MGATGSRRIDDLLVPDPVFRRTAHDPPTRHRHGRSRAASDGVEPGGTDPR